MRSRSTKLGLSLPAVSTVIVLVAVLSAAWLLWGELGKRGWIPGMSVEISKAAARVQTIESLVNRGRMGIPTLVDDATTQTPEFGAAP